MQRVRSMRWRLVAVSLALAGCFGASMGFFGGDSKDHLKESFDDTARDLAKFLVRLRQGEAPPP